MTPLPLTLTDAAARLRDGSLTSLDLVESCIARADAVDSVLGVYLHRRFEAALAEAHRADADFARGRDRGPLQGIPIGIKDVVATVDEPTTAQSLVLDRSWGEGVDAPVVARLRDAGAIVTGKTTTMEFAAGCPDPDKPFPIPRNPWDTRRWAGGSSSGTASGVASGCFLGGVGTDTLGSVRGPAAFCGVTGIKPTFGLVPKSGTVPLVPSFDHVGPLARSARDCALMLQAMAGYDASDPLCVDSAIPDYVAALDGSVEGLHIGVERANHLGAAGIDAAAVDAFEAAVQVLEKAGAKVTEVTIPQYDDLKTACVVVALSEAFTLQRSNLQQRWFDFGHETRLLLAAGALFTAADLVQARRVIDTARRQVDAIFGGVDVIAMPTIGVGALPLDGLSFLTLMAAPAFTQVWDGLRHPVISVPMGFTNDKLPLGLQLAGRNWDEATLLRAADAYQRRTDWHLQLPTVN